MADSDRKLAVAVAAVRSAARVCRTIQGNLVQADTLQKQDRSPVTVADFASQAIVCHHLRNACPGDGVVGEEDAHALRRKENRSLRGAVTRNVSTALATPVTEETVLAWIDYGGAPADGRRYWTLDPIDGTKGFLRGGQYAVALALIEDGEVVLGVLGCPNLQGPGEGLGVLFAARRGESTQALPLDDDQAGGVKIRVAAVTDPAAARLCESVESRHSDQSASARIAARLGVTGEPIRMDSQCKYGIVARGDASIYLRLPTRADYREKIWDHAAGALVVQAAGGTVTDINGRPLDFRSGRCLDGNRGVVATGGTIHAAVLDVVRHECG